MCDVNIKLQTNCYKKQKETFPENYKRTPRKGKRSVYNTALRVKNSNKNVYECRNSLTLMFCIPVSGIATPCKWLGKVMSWTKVQLILRIMIMDL